MTKKTLGITCGICLLLLAIVLCGLWGMRDHSAVDSDNEVLIQGGIDEQNGGHSLKQATMTPVSVERRAPQSDEASPITERCRLFGSIIASSGVERSYAAWVPLFGVDAVGNHGQRVQGVVDKHGQYEIDNLRPGEWFVRAVGIELVEATALVVLTAGESRRLDIEFGQRDILDVSLADARGQTILASSDALQWQVVAKEDAEVVARKPYSVLDSMRFIGTTFFVDPGLRVRDVAVVADRFDELRCINAMFLGEGDVVGRLVIESEEWPFVTLFIGDVSVDCRRIGPGREIEFVLDDDVRERLTGSVRFGLWDDDYGLIGENHEEIRVSWADGSLDVPAGNGQEVIISGLLPGQREVAVDGYGLDPGVRHIDLPPGGQVDLGTLAVEMNGRILGCVTTGDGLAVANARIACWKDEGSRGITEIGQYGWQSDLAGRFDIPVPQGLFFLRVVRGFAADDIVVGSQSVRIWVDRAEKQINLVAAPLEQVVCEQLNNKGSSVEILFVDKNGVRLSRKELSGEHILVSLPPGEAEYRCYDAKGAEVMRRKVAVRTGARITQY